MGRLVVLMGVLCMLGSLMPVAAGANTPAAKRPSAAQKARIRANLTREIRRDPAVIRRRSFLRRAALVNFKLPVTIRIRSRCAASSSQGVGSCGPSSSQGAGTGLNQQSDGTAQVDLGPTLGQRTVALGGSLAAEVQFNDSYDGGALGNVQLRILPSKTKFLTTSSVPLLWNPDASDPATRSDANYIKAGSPATGIDGNLVRQGCGDFYSSGPGGTSASGLPGYNAFAHGFTPSGSTFGTAAGLPGYPYYATATGLTPPLGYFPIYPGVDGLDVLQSDSVTGNNDHIGPAQSPFPGAPGYSQPTSTGGLGVEDTVFRTNALHLAIANPGVYVDGQNGTSSVPGPTGLTNGPSGTESIITGASGGQANLFGNIPGKKSAIDVTVNLSAAINAIARIMDQDVFDLPLVSGSHWPASVFNCHQVWLEAVQNYIPGVRLTGSLRIAPAITKDGKLRIAKATVGTDPNNPPHVALSACLFPTSAYVDYNDDPGSFGFSNQTVAGLVPYPTTTGTPAQLGNGLWPVNSDALPVFTNAEKFDPADPSYSQFGGNGPTGTTCNSAAYELVKDAALFPSTVEPYLPANLGDGYTTTASGSTVTVAGDISVSALQVDVLIGDQ